MMIKNSNKQENCCIFWFPGFFFWISYLFEFYGRKSAKWKNLGKNEFRKTWLDYQFDNCRQNECARECVHSWKRRERLVGEVGHVGRHLSNVAFEILFVINVAHSRSIPAIANDNIAEARYEKKYIWIWLN